MIFQIFLASLGLDLPNSRYTILQPLLRHLLFFLPLREHLLLFFLAHEVPRFADNISDVTEGQIAFNLQVFDVGLKVLNELSEILPFGVDELDVMLVFSILFVNVLDVLGLAGILQLQYLHNPIFQLVRVFLDVLLWIGCQLSQPLLVMP